jgi:nitric oxide reductase activation protein
VSEAYEAVADAMGDSFSDEELALWAKEGVAIGTQTVRSWESAVEYYRVSPEVARSLAFASFMQWARCGTYLSQDSPTLAVAFFKASPTIVTNLRPQYIPRWAGLGRSLYKGTWKSSTLAARFFEVSPDLVRNLPFWDVEVFASLIEALSYKSYDVAAECLVLGRDVLPGMGREREAFLSMSRALTDTSWREVKACLEMAPRALQHVEEGQTGRFLRLGERLAKMGLRDTSRFLYDGAQALSHVSAGSQGHILDLCEGLLATTPDAVPPFLKSLDPVLNRITLPQLDQWYQQGVELLNENPESGIAFFKIESNTSEAMLETLSSSLDLERVKGIMRLYTRALSGTNIEVMSTEELVRRQIGWVDQDTASTDGTKVYLPPMIDNYNDKSQNFAWFKVVATHQVSHLEFGSFEFEFDRPANIFDDRRIAMENAMQARLDAIRSVAAENFNMQDMDVSVTSDIGDGPGGTMRVYTDIGRFLALFEDRRMAFDLFSVLEDCRLDYLIKTDYPGIRRPALDVQGDALAQRPRVEELPLQEALIELLVHMSLDRFEGLLVPQEYREEAYMLARIMHRLRTIRASIEDTAEASLRAYEIISRLQNQQQPEDEYQPEDLDDPGEFSEEEYEALLDKLQAQMDEQQGEQGEGDPYESPEPVEYRGDFKPEMVQLLTKLQMDQSQMGDAEPMTQEELEQLLQDSAELELDAQEGDVDQSMAMFAQNIMKEAGVPPPSNDPGRGYGPILHDDDAGGELEALEPKTFVYDEWDFRANDYKPRWCIVRQKQMSEGDPAYYGQTLAGYSTLVNQIRRQFELLVPEMFRKQRKLEDGEEIDIDDVIEAMVDIRTGSSPSDKLYWRRNKVQRDVAVVFLLDTSASTAEAVDESRKGEDWDAPDDPVEYMTWLRTRRGEGMRRSYKRIIDLEKEACVLLINALEAVGDRYGIYAFSGYGRENVEFYVIKDMGENFSERVKNRIDKISPLHATRMGPAIRHCVSKLEVQEARTKVLFLISDGRPQDRGYSREGVEKEYAVHDTKKALQEARAKHIVPFCLTVDRGGHDYLKTMCQDMGYEVVPEIETLPKRLPYLYRRLTV